MEDGLPKYVALEKVRVEKKLPPAASLGGLLNSVYDR